MQSKYRSSGSRQLEIIHQRKTKSRYSNCLVLILLQITFFLYDTLVYYEYNLAGFLHETDIAEADWVSFVYLSQFLCPRAEIEVEKTFGRWREG